MKVFATRVWGFGPSEWPVIPFGLEGNRDKLLRDSSVGDRIIFAATQGDPTAIHERGRILGMAEIGRIAVDTADVVEPRALVDHDYDPNGNLRWPKSLLMVRAWQFTDPPKVTDVLYEQLPYNATAQAVKLSIEDAEAVLSLPHIEVDLPRSETLDRLRGWDEALKSQRSHGPVPTNWQGVVEKNADQAGFTYAFRFGKTLAWKVGRAINVKARLDAVNKHIPESILGAKWEAKWQHPWGDLNRAHKMEQDLLDLLEPHSIGGEMVKCSESQMEAAWYRALSGK